MTALAMPEASSTATSVRALARYETWRLARHPLFVVVVLLSVAIVVTSPIDPNYGDADYRVTAEGPNTSLDWPVAISFLIGLGGLIAMNRLASSADRAGEVLDASPVPEWRRTVALCLACLLPASIGLVLTAYMAWFWLVDPPIHARGWSEFSDAELMAVLAPGVLACLGGPLLGVLVARWWRWPTAAAVTCVLLVLWCAASITRGTTSLLTALGLSAPWNTPLESFGDEAWREGGNLYLRVVYLATMCGLAAAGAIAHGTEGRLRRRLALVVGILAALALAVLVLATFTGPVGHDVDVPAWPPQ
jgi:hypothetical protein